VLINGHDDAVCMLTIVVSKIKGDLMEIDVPLLSSKLLQRLANSIHDRESNFKDFCFSSSEIQVVESWINDTVKEILKSMAEY
jgi:hypothetical protein